MQEHITAENPNSVIMKGRIIYVAKHTYKP